MAECWQPSFEGWRHQLTSRPTNRVAGPMVRFCHARRWEKSCLALLAKVRLESRRPCWVCAWHKSSYTMVYGNTSFKLAFTVSFQKEFQLKTFCFDILCVSFKWWAGEWKPFKPWRLPGFFWLGMILRQSIQHVNFFCLWETKFTQCYISFKFNELICYLDN
jgi:hypothetical protein